MCYWESSSLRANFKDSDLEDEFKALIPNQNRILSIHAGNGTRRCQTLLMRSEKPHQALVSLLAFRIGRAYGEWFIPRHDVRVMRALAFRTVSFVIENHCDILLPRYTSVFHKSKISTNIYKRFISR